MIFIQNNTETRMRVFTLRYPNTAQEIGYLVVSEPYWQKRRRQWAKEPSSQARLPHSSRANYDG